MRARECVHSCKRAYFQQNAALCLGNVHLASDEHEWTRLIVQDMFAAGVCARARTHVYTHPCVCVYRLVSSWRLCQVGLNVLVSVCVLLQTLSHDAIFLCAHFCVIRKYCIRLAQRISDL